MLICVAVVYCTTIQSTTSIPSCVVHKCKNKVAVHKRWGSIVVGEVAVFEDNPFHGKYIHSSTNERIILVAKKGVIVREEF